MEGILIVVAEHIAALGPIGALASLRRGCPRDAAAHLEDELGRLPTIPEHGALIREIRNAARSLARSMLTEAEVVEDPEYFGIDVDALERALFADDEAEPVYACGDCNDRGYILTSDDEGLRERDACACTFAPKAAA